MTLATEVMNWAMITAAHGTGIYFEAALIIAMLGFVSTVAYARFVLRGDIIE